MGSNVAEAREGLSVECRVRAGEGWTGTRARVGTGMDSDQDGGRAGPTGAGERALDRNPKSNPQGPGCRVRPQAQPEKQARATRARSRPEQLLERPTGPSHRATVQAPQRGRPPLRCLCPLTSHPRRSGGRGE